MASDDKQRQLDKIRKSIVEDNVCPELAVQATQPVFGEGNPDADAVFIGEAPGKREDELGRPFVGAAGKFLDEMLASIGLARKDVYITNIVKYRPPDNRDPLPEEKKAFLPYLQAQLEVIQPKILVTLGRHAANCFLPDLRISVEHGMPRRVRINGHEPTAKSGAAESADDCLTIAILPLFHPAAALYNGGLRQTLIDDFAKIPSAIKQADITQQSDMSST